MILHKIHWQALLRLCVWIVALTVLTLLNGCQSPQQKAQQTMAEGMRARERAREQSIILYEKARDFRAQGKIQDARRAILEATNADNGNLYAWMLLGTIEFESDQFFEAAYAFEQARRLAPGQYEPLFNLGTVLEAAGRLDEAAKVYEAALELSPGQLEVIENLARAYVRAGTNLERARELAAQALDREWRPEWREWLGRQSIRKRDETLSTIPTTMPEKTLTEQTTVLPSQQ